MKSLVISMAGALALAAAQVHAAGAEMIVNGGFESPAYGAVGSYFGPGDGWTRSAWGGVSIINGDLKLTPGGRVGRTPFGQQYLGIDPHWGFNPYAHDAQTIPGFVAGQKYKLSLGAADSNGGDAPRLELTLVDDGGNRYFDKIYDLPVGGPWVTKIQFSRIAAIFKAPITGALTLLVANAGEGQFPGSLAIDRVSLVPVSEDEAAAVDETVGGTTAASR